MSDDGAGTPMEMDDTPRAQDTPQVDGDVSDSSGSGSGKSSDSEEEEEVEWLASTRTRRSNAGNRMRTLIEQNQQDPDEDLAEIFGEVEDDEGFEDAGELSDVQMDSSDDDEDQGPSAQADDMEGEKELQRQEKDVNQAKKRKIKDGIPIFMKNRVKKHFTALRTAPLPRPKKKSERTSWIPAPEDQPTRVSSRGTTKKSKEQLHKQMIDREIKRLKQLANMEKAAVKKKALEKPALTQEDRMRDALRIEKSNKKSLSRWEEAEQQREEEQMLKLAALKNRQMDGPVFTWWSGMSEWYGGKLKCVGKNQVVEEVKEKPKEKPIPRKRKASEMMAEEPSLRTLQGPATEDGKLPELMVTESNDIQQQEPAPEPNEAIVTIAETPKSPSRSINTGQLSDDAPLTSSPKPKDEPEKQPEDETTIPAASPKSPSPKMGSEEPSVSNSPAPLSAPASAPPPPPPAQVRNQPSPYSHPAPSSVLAPSSNGVPPPPPPPPPTYPPFRLAPPILDGSAPLPDFYSHPYSQHNSLPPHPPNFTPSQSPYALAPASSQPLPVPQPEVPPAPPVTEYAARNYIILSNFDELAIKNKDVQTEIIFRRKFNKIHKPKSHTTPCAITGYPAKYRDPTTGLPYCNAFAFREIQRLTRGDYRWSKLVGAYVGEGKSIARGVPPRFGNPNWKKPETSSLPVERDKSEADVNANATANDNAG